VERICDRSSGGLRPVSGQEEEIKVIKETVARLQGVPLAGLQCQANIMEKGKVYEKKSGFVD